MKKEELSKIIELLESSNSLGDAYLALHQYGGGPHESFAKANKEGLELLAAQLLKASRDFEDVLKEDEKIVIPIDYEGDWINGDILIQYVEPVDKKGDEIREASRKEGLFNKLIPFGCIGGLILLVVLAGIGVVSILKWIF